MLEVYEGKTFFIPVDIMENVVKSVARKLYGIIGTGGIDPEDLQGWLLKFWYHRKNNCVSVESFVAWLANHNPPWAAYQ